MGGMSERAGLLRVTRVPWSALVPIWARHFDRMENDPVYRAELEREYEERRPESAANA